MSRRPKLSLSSHGHVDKKQAPGFAAAAGNSEITPGATNSAPGNRDAPGAAERGGKRGPQVVVQPAASRRFLKVVLVVVAAALSWYLLKRRLL